MKRGAEFLLVCLIQGYRFLISPVIHVLAGPGYGCRFTPSCSEFALEAVRNVGVIQGLKVSFDRILRCRPGVPGGWDPPPGMG